MHSQLGQYPKEKEHFGVWFLLGYMALQKATVHKECIYVTLKFHVVDSEENV